jgi:hypothetical protein
MCNYCEDFWDNEFGVGDDLYLGEDDIVIECNGKHILSISLTVFINDKAEMEIYGCTDEDEDAIIKNIPIKYCPMCGERLVRKDG